MGLAPYGGIRTPGALRKKKARQQIAALALFATEESYALRILPHPHERVAKIGLFFELQEMKPHQGQTGQRHHRTDHREQIPARNLADAHSAATATFAHSGSSVLLKTVG